eukprot:COSAG04_NODE_18567_length_438_cov_0.917404_2_plen_92_part_01
MSLRPFLFYQLLHRLWQHSAVGVKTQPSGSRLQAVVLAGRVAQHRRDAEGGRVPSEVLLRGRERANHREEPALQRAQPRDPRRRGPDQRAAF